MSGGVDTSRVTPHRSIVGRVGWRERQGSAMHAQPRLSGDETLDVYSGLFDDDLDGVAAKLDQECQPIATRESRGEVIELRPSL